MTNLQNDMQYLFVIPTTLFLSKRFVLFIKDFFHMSIFFPQQLFSDMRFVDNKKNILHITGFVGGNLYTLTITKYNMFSLGSILII